MNTNMCIAISYIGVAVLLAKVIFLDSLCIHMAKKLYRIKLTVDHIENYLSSATGGSEEENKNTQ